MTRAERYALIKPMREDEGLTWREIGERLGISLKYANDIYTDPSGEARNARHRASNARLRHPCPRCGELTSKRAEVCRECELALRRRGYEERIVDVAAMYNEGLPLKEIARHLGYGPTSAAPEVAEARKRGLIGYRYKGCEGRNVAA